MCGILAVDVLGGRDLFEVWRLVLGTICTIYALVMTARSLWRWCVYLSGADRTVSMMRSYMIVQLLRLRFRRFTREFVQIGLWLLILATVLYWHES
ncbi:MAG: hypothetical protein JXQ75_11210 [Phycisphaerae bacterium]|nr:hypothetical protein [Phycisphaerae bacterium]